MTTKIQFEQSDVVYNWDKKLKEIINDLPSQSHSTNYCYQYLDYVELIKDNITAQKTGDWHLHLMRRMKTLLVATAHTYYTKSARLYLQTMMVLPENYPWVYEQVFKL